MSLSNRDYDLADQRADQERAAGLRAIQTAQAGKGTETCVDCRDPIDLIRRKAVPSARRCVSCQSVFERA